MSETAETAVRESQALQSAQFKADRIVNVSPILCISSLDRPTAYGYGPQLLAEGVLLVAHLLRASAYTECLTN